MIANSPQARLLMTPEEFEAYVMLPENEDRFLELIDGEVFDRDAADDWEAAEVVSNNYPGETVAILLILIGSHVYGNKLGRVYSPESGFKVNNSRVMPDISFLTIARQPEPSHETWNTNSPDLAVEVLSPSDRPRAIRRKLANYLKAGTTTWIVNPEAKTVEVYAPGEDALLLTADDTLEGGTHLPGFSVKVADIFPK